MSSDRQNAGVTVGELIDHLKSFDRDTNLYMGGLQFYRLKQRGENLVQMEFNQQVYRDRAGKLVAEDVA